LLLVAVAAGLVGQVLRGGLVAVAVQVGLLILTALLLQVLPIPLLLVQVVRGKFLVLTIRQQRA
jgi:hypothetical protein